MSDDVNNEVKEAEEKAKVAEAAAEEARKEADRIAKKAREEAESKKAEEAAKEAKKQEEEAKKAAAEEAKKADEAKKAAEAKEAEAKKKAEEDAAKAAAAAAAEAARKQQEAAAAKAAKENEKKQALLALKASCPPQYKPVSTSTYFWTGILCWLPCIGFFITLILSFAPKNRNLKSFARSKLAYYIIIFISCLIIMLVAGAVIPEDNRVEIANAFIKIGRAVGLNI